jgi:hypothetical protein
LDRRRRFGLTGRSGKAPVPVGGAGVLKLYFLRHGQAGSRQEWHGDDTKRPFTVEGKKRMKREAATI